MNNITILFLSLIFCSCNGQKTRQSYKVKTFDIERFERDVNLRESKTADTRSKDYRWKEITYENQGNIITLGQQGDGNYREEIKKKKSVYRKRSVYYEDTHTLAYEGTYFQDVPVGIEKNYSKKGILVNEKDHDKISRGIGILTVKEMIEMMKKEFSIDITKEDELEFLGYFEKEGKYICQIICKSHPERKEYASYNYLFDAQTGEFLGKDIFSFEE